MKVASYVYIWHFWERLLYVLKSVNTKLSSIMLHCIITKVATYMNRGRSKRPFNDVDQSIDGWNVPS